MHSCSRGRWVRDSHFQKRSTRKSRRPSITTLAPGTALTSISAASMATNQTGINSLLVFDMPMEVGWKLGELPMRIFGDFAVNLEGDARAKAALHPNKGDH